MGQTTSFDKVISRLLRKIEKDKDFFAYYNLSVSEVQSLVIEQAVGYLYDAVDLLTSKCEPEVNFYNYDEELQIFNFELTQREIGLLSSLMYEVYFERDEALLKAFKIRMTPSDLNQFSSASERKTFEDMLQRIKNENTNKIAKYVSTDRNTGKRKTIDHSQYDYD
mgnify:CR=1 FL=1